MNAPEPRLEQVQRWMQSVITHPGGVAEGVESPAAREHLEVKLANLETIIRRSRALASADRLEIYVNAYYARLLECLDEEFAVTRHALGEELFGALAFGYLQHYPSHSYTLGQLGASFPRFLAETRLHAGEAPDHAPATWPEFIVELATFERTLYEVYDGPGTEGAETLSPDALAAVLPEAWGGLRLTVAPSLRLLEFAHPVHESWAARKDGGEPAPPEPRRSWLAVHRRDFMVERAELLAAEHAVLTAIATGASLADALAAVAGTPALESQLGGWFARWTAAGYFTGLTR
jgi:hypothetical protein